MGRRKKADIEEALNLSNEVSEQEETPEESKKEVKEETKEETTEAAAETEASEKKPRRRRSPRKAAGLSIENAAVEETQEGPKEIVADETPEEKDAVGTEIENPPAPARSRGRRKSTDDGEQLTANASEKSMAAMAHQWESIQKIAAAVTAQLEKSSETIKGMPESILEAHPELVKAPGQKSQLIAKFAIAASVVAVVLSLLSLSLSQSARQAVLSAEVARKAQSMAVTKPASIMSNEIAALPFEKTNKKNRKTGVYGPHRK